MRRPRRVDAKQAIDLAANAMTDANEETPGLPEVGSAADALVKEILTLFMRTETVVRTTRITRKGEIVQPVDDLATTIESVMRNFKHDFDANKATATISQLQSQLTSRFKQWEQETNQLKATRVEVRNTPSGDELRRMAAEASAVKTSVTTAQSKIRALLTALAQFAVPADGQPVAPLEVAKADRPLSAGAKCLVGLLGDGLTVCGEEADRIGFGTRQRELVIDRRKKVLVIVRWDLWGKDQLALTLWVVPKSPSATGWLRDMEPALLAIHDLRSGGEHRPDFEWVEHGPDASPEADSIKQFLGTIQSERFDVESVPLRYWRATLNLEVDFSDGVLRTEFLLRVNDRA